MVPSQGRESSETAVFRRGFEDCLRHNTHALHDKRTLDSHDFEKVLGRFAAQNFSEGASKWLHHANEIKIALAISNKVGWTRAHQPNPGARQDVTAANAIITRPAEASHPNAWAVFSHGSMPSPIKAMFLSAILSGSRIRTTKTISR